jgi:tetratricopeptide (TPR) repeat protein
MWSMLYSPRTRPLAACVALLFAAAGPAAACLWDRDTLADEQRGLPEMAAIITGRYERHTPEFFERRIREAQSRLKTADGETAKALLDDIGVAYDRLDRQPHAISAMREKISRFGVDYTTAANLGTFYAHAGDMDQAENWIRRAVKINPDAHFGREWVQLRAIQYFRDLRKAKTPEAKQKVKFWDRDIDKRAVEGAAGIIKMGDRAVPEIYVALGEALREQEHNSLAVMAYWRAMDLGGPKHPLYPEWEREAADTLRKIRTDFIPRLISRADYDKHRAYAERWVAAYQAHERALVGAGRDLEAIANYRDFYRKWGTPREPYPRPFLILGLSPFVWAGAALAVGGALFWRRLRRRRRKPWPVAT